MQQEEPRAVVNSDISIYSLVVEDEIYFQLRLTKMILPIPLTFPLEDLTWSPLALKAWDCPGCQVCNTLIDIKINFNAVYSSVCTSV